MTKYSSPFLSKSTQTTSFKKPGNWAAGYHTGEDWVCDNHTLVSPTGGTVSFVGYDSDGYGNYLIIHTADNNCILMGHMASKPLVKVGDKVTARQKLGTMGSTGNSTGPHLHIEVEKGTDWNYNKNLLKPSDYIDFGNYKESVNGMKNGDKSDAIFAYKLILIQLQQKGVISQGVDANGIFGNGTEIATKQVQKAAKLKQTGIADKITVKEAAKLLANAK
ncbi:MAG: peptidoglycan DD-metalloendopeptidase family protein [Acutalibacteraceae bacterium]